MSFEFNRGNDVNLNLTFKDKAGQPIDLTGKTVFFTAKSDPECSDENADIQAQTTDHSDPTNGVTVVSLSHTQTLIDAGTYQYDFKLAEGGVVVSTKAGTLTVLQNVTARIS